jgi:hypothetical protein
MGLLDGSMQAPQQGGGLLGAMPQQSQGGGTNGRDLQMAQQLLQNPTPEMGQQIVAQMRQAGMPEADQIEQFLTQVGGDTNKIREMAQQVVQALSQ